MIHSKTEQYIHPSAVMANRSSTRFENWEQNVKDRSNKSNILVVNRHNREITIQRSSSYENS